MISVTNFERAAPLVRELSELEEAMDRSLSRPRLDFNSRMHFDGHDCVTLGEFVRLSCLPCSDLNERVGAIVHSALASRREELLVRLASLGVVPDEVFSKTPGSEES